MSGAQARVTEQLVCRLPGDDPWMQNMLRPIVEAAGYLVVGDENDGDADLVIAAQGAKVAGEAAKKTIWLRTEAEAVGQEGREHLSLRSRRAADRAEDRWRREGQMNELLLVVTIDGERVALPAAAVEVGGRARYPDPGATSSTARRRPLCASQPGPHRHRLQALARAWNERLLRRHTRSGGRRVRRTPLCADRRSRRRRGRGLVGTQRRCARPWAMAGSGSRRA